mgnify:CR=1 FL=1
MLQFQGFKPDALNRMAKTMGYSGDMGEFNKFLNENPEKQEMMDVYSEKAKEMMMGGYVKGYANGGVVQAPGMENIPGTLSYEHARMRASQRDIKSPYEQANIDAALALGPGTRYTIPPEQIAQMQAQQDYFTANNSLMASAAPQGNPSTGMINLSTEMLAGQQRPPRLEDAIKPLMVAGPGLPPPQIIDPRIQQPVQRNPNVVSGYYDSPEYNDFRNDRRNQIGTMDVRSSPYFGRQGSGSVGGAADQAYIDYLNRSGQTSYLQGGTDYTSNPNYDEYIKSQGNVGPIQQVSGPSDGLNLGMQQQALNPTVYGPTGTVGRAANPQTNEPPSARVQATAPVSPVDYTQGPVPQSTGYQGGTIAEAISNRAFNPAMPYGTTVQPVGTAYNANQAVDTTLGQVSGTIAPTTATATATQATGPTAAPATTMAAETAANEIGIATDTLTAAQGAVDPRAVVAAQSTVNTGVSTLDAVQGTSILMSNPNQRKVQTGELVSGAANAQTASTFTEQVQAAEATPTNKATVQGQLEGLLAAFEGGNTPVWAAGAMRNVSTQMANRGLGASSMAAQALIQGALESALPIAQADASVIAQFEAQNLSNRQQRAMLAAQQRATFMGMEFDQAFQARVQNSARIGDIANMNFTADQQVALENSRVANTVNLQNLNNSQAMVMAEAAALSQLDMANLSNRQQSAVMNAQSFMQMDMANLSSQQQTEMFKAQSRIQSLFTDQAAENAAKQFNATSQNQTDQFFASLASTTSQFNAAQSNAQSQFNAGQTNAMSEFQASIKNQRDQFNAQNRLVIDQNNAQWRRQIATADTVAINRANEINATNLLGMSTQAYNDLWQYYSDSMEFAWTSVENEQERMNKLAQIQLTGDVKMKVQDLIGDQAAAKGFGNMITEMFVGGTGFLPGLFKKE